MAVYRKDIDGLRALAILLVLIFHFDLSSVGNAGFVGVDVFFVISGFLITSIIQKELSSNTFILATFYFKRIRRLAPALFTVLLLTMVTGYITLFPDDFTELSRQALFSQFYIANLYYWQHINYFGLNVDDIFLLHTWSLSIEEQFYFFYPLILIAAYRYFREHFWTLLALGAILSFTLNLYFIGIKPEATFYLLPTRAWELLIGGLIPIINAKWIRQKYIDEILSLFGLIIIILSVVTYREEYSFPGYFALIPTLGAASFILSGGNFTPLASKYLSLSPLLYIGKISYPLYLVHWPINVFANIFFASAYDYKLRVLMFILSFIFASVIYHGVETPIRRKKFIKNNTSLGKFYLAGLIGVIFSFAMLQFYEGLPNRFPPEAIEMADNINDKSPPLKSCEYKDNTSTVNSQYCVIGVRGQEPTWLIFGDSHAWAGYEAFNQWLLSEKKTAYFAYQHSCPPIFDVYIFGLQNQCHNFNHSIKEFIEKNSVLQNIFLVSTWSQATNGDLSTSANLKLPLKDSQHLFSTSFSKTLQHFNDFEKNVYVWEPLPGAQDNVPLALARSILNNKKVHLNKKLEEYLESYDLFFSVLHNNRELITDTFSPSEELCDDKFCSVTIDGAPAYFDSSHMSRSTYKFWVAALQEQFAL